MTLAAEAEHRAAEHHRALAATLAAEDPGLAELFTQAANDESDCALEAATRAGVIPLHKQQIEPPSLDDGLALLEESFERYSDIAERAKDELVVREAQSLAERSVRRLSMVYGSIAHDHSGAADEA